MAKGLLDLLPATNSAFDTNFTTQDVANSLFDAMGIPPNNNCAYQAILVDTGSKLRISTSPMRMAWARSALLWHLLQTTDTSAISYIRGFLDRVNFAALGTDTATERSGYQISSGGFVFDFAKMAVTIESISWKKDSQASDGEASKVKDALSVALDKMYSNALGECQCLCCAGAILRLRSDLCSWVHTTSNGIDQVLEVVPEPEARRSLQVPGHHRGVPHRDSVRRDGFECRSEDC